jgi:CoA:oxalate CoA-transferase
MCCHQPFQNEKHYSQEAALEKHKGPLSGIQIIDFTQAHAGSLCTMLLADFGAEIIKIERPGVGDQCRYWPPFKGEHSAYFSFLNRGKKSITIDARTEAGRDIIKKLVSRADVVCENFKVGNMERLGIGYEELKKVNPRLIYGSISGFGITGPIRNSAAYDLMLQAMSGIADLTGARDGAPTKAGPAIGDHFSGVYMAIAICLALIYRERSGEGQRAEISILDTLFSALDSAPVTYSITGENPRRNGNRGRDEAPSDTFKTLDGFISIMITTDHEWKNFCRTIERSDLVNHPNFCDARNRLENYTPGLKSIITNYVRDKNSCDVEKSLQTAGIACARVMSIKEVIDLDHINAREMLIDVADSQIGSIRMPGISIKLSSTPGSVAFGAEALGESTDAVLLNAGFTRDEVAAFRVNQIL